MSTSETTSHAAPRSPLMILVGVIVAALAVLGVFVLSSRKSAAETKEGAARRDAVAQGPLVKAVIANVVAPNRSVSLPGDVKAFAQSTLYAKVAGYLKTIKVDRGDRVKENQLLATLEAPEVDQALNAAKADLANKEAQSRRTRGLASKGISSEQDAENAEATVKVAEAALKSALAMQSYEEIRAPFPGIITARYVDPGALLPAATGSTQAAQPVVDIAQMSTIRIFVYLGQEDAALVRTGDPALVTVDARPEATVHATVTRISQSIDLRTRTMLCEIDVENANDALFPGAFVHVQLSLGGQPHPQVPAEALISRSDKLFIAVIRDGKAHLVPVTVGVDDGKNVQVTSGLSGGEQVAVGAASDIQDDAPVRIAPEK